MKEWVLLLPCSVCRMSNRPPSSRSSLQGALSIGGATIICCLSPSASV